MKAGLSTLYYSGLSRMMASRWQGMGAIYMLHRVLPDTVAPFAPNAILQVTPTYLEAVIHHAQRQGYEFVSLDEVYKRLAALKDGADVRDFEKFICMTLDDGYRDNAEHAAPLFRKYNVPYAVYVPSDYPDGKGELWWVALEQVIASHDQLDIELGEEAVSLVTDSVESKWAAWEQIYSWLRHVEEPRQRSFVRNLCAQYDVDLEALCRELILDWDGVRALDSDPLCTIAGHTVGHYAIGKLDEARAVQEMKEGLVRLESELGHKVEHFSYPYGDAASAGPRDFQLAGELGLKTAVTTRKGLVYPEHASHLMALPRVSLNGSYQQLHYNDVYLSGSAFALTNRLSRVNVG